MLAIIELILITNISQLFKIDLVAQHSANTTKALHKLISLARAIRHEFQARAEILVALSKPFKERALVDEIHFLSCLLIHKHLAVGFLAFLGMDNDFRATGGFEDPASDFEILINDQSLASAGFKGFKRVVDSVTDFPAVEIDFVKVFIDETFFLDELDITQSLRCQVYSLIETILTTVRDVDDFDDFALEAIVEHVGLIEVVFEICRTSEDETCYIDFVLGDEVLDCEFGDFADVVVAFLFSETGETEG